MRNLGYCNFAKTVLMLLVVLCHSAAFYGGNWFRVCTASETNEVLAILSSWLGTFHVEGFTLISGYIYYYIKYEKEGYQDFRKYIKNKFKRLLVPYIAISLFWIIPIGAFFYSYSLIDVIEDYALGESPSQLWFLLMLFNVFVIYDYILTKIKCGQIVLVFILFASGIVLGNVVPNIFQIMTSMRYLLFFYIGCMIRKKYSDMQSDKMLIFGIIFLFVNLVFFTLLNTDIFENGIIGKVMSLLSRNLCDVSGAIMAFLLLSYLASKLRWDNKIFTNLTIVSFPIYLFHQQIIYVLLWNFQSFINSYVMCALNFLLSILVSYYISLILMKHKFTRFLIGIKQ